MSIYDALYPQLWQRDGHETRAAAIQRDKQ